MRKIIIFMFFILLATLMACSTEEVPSNHEGNAKKEVAENEEAKAQEKEKSEKETSDNNAVDENVANNNDEEADESENASNQSPSDVKGILKKSAEAMETVTAMELTGETESTMDMAGTKGSSISQLSGTISLNPIAQHIRMESESDQEGTENSEMYWTDEGIYFLFDEAEGWLMMPSGVNEGIRMGEVAAVTETQFDYFSSHHESFDLTEGDEYYTLSLSNSGDAFKELVYGSLKDIAGEDAYHGIVDFISDIEGTYELKIDKETYYIISLQLDIDLTTAFGGMDMEVASTEHTYYEYSNFNEVEEVSVPTEVVESASDFAEMIQQDD